jgi:hypothetical protein
MRSKKSYWFEVSVHLQRMAEDGSNKAVTEIYAVDANSFSEAEKRIQKELSTQVRGGIEVKNINPAPYKEVSSPMMKQAITGIRPSCRSSVWMKSQARRNAPTPPTSYRQTLLPKPSVMSNTLWTEPVTM